MLKSIKKQSIREVKIMRHTIVVLATLITLSLLSCDTTAPYTGSAELTIHLSTSNSADVITGEFILQNNADSSQIHREFTLSSIVSFSGIETGEYSLMLGSQKIADNISVSKRKTTLYVQLEETEVEEIMEKAKQTYVDTFMTHDATIDDASFKPFIGIFDGILVAVFYEGKLQPPYGDFVLEAEIGSLTFHWPYGYPILVWNEDTIYELSDAFEQGLLSREDLETIYISHWKYFENENWWVDRPILNADTMQRLKYDYIDFAPSIERFGDNINKVVIHNYYGVFNNCVVLALSSVTYLIIDVPGASETVAERFFEYSKIGHEILVWHEGVFYRLGQAYTENLLIDDDIETIWHQYQEKYHNWD